MNYPFQPIKRSHVLLAVALFVWIFVFLFLTEPLDVSVLNTTEKLTYLPLYGLAGAEKFYAKIASELGAKELVLDLRNNGGGGDRNSNVLLKLLKDIDKQQQIHVLINHNTGSNAEQFAAKLKAWGNVTVYGDKTN